MTEATMTVEVLSAEAQANFASAKWDLAAHAYRKLMRKTHVIDYEYREWLERLTECYGEMGDNRSRGLILLYQGEHERAASALSKPSDISIRARVFVSQENWADAALEFKRAGMPVHQAVYLEKHGDLASTAPIWQSLLQKPRDYGHAYERALMTYNLSRALEVGDESESALRTLSESLRQLEIVADDFENEGERERAFDCYLVLVNIGRESGQFENLAEGYLNCIRILKEDSLKFYVLQYYEDFIALALERNEFHAAATLLQEVATYASQHSLPYSGSYMRRSGDTWLKAAEAQRERGQSERMVENSLRAALSSFVVVQEHSKVMQSLEALEALNLSAEQREKFAALKARFQEQPDVDNDLKAFPEYLKQRDAYADIWLVDTMEFELGGDVFEVALSIVADRRFPDRIRRRALLLALLCEHSEHDGERRSPEQQIEVAELLGQLQVYAALKPLEVLYEHQDENVRTGVVRSLRYLFFKRTFALVRKALRDPNPRVFDAAIETLRGLHFQHAFNSLVHIFNDSSDERVRRAAIASIGKIQSVESVTFLLSLLGQFHHGAMRKEVEGALAQIDNPDAFPLFQHHLGFDQSDADRALLEELIRRGG